MPVSDLTPIPGFHAIVPAGGAGTRLWPLSRQGRPKFLLDLTGAGRTLLQGTVDRLVPLTGPEGTFIVTGPEGVGTCTRAPWKASPIVTGSSR